jgi:nucleoside-diphosphate-sugar epimerase
MKVFLTGATGVIGRRAIPLLISAGHTVTTVARSPEKAAAVRAALAVPGGVYNVVDDEPLPRRAFYDSLAEALGVPPPKLLPAWVKVLAGSLGETTARSLRISNRKLRQASGWAPRYPSVREGWRSVV